MSDDHKPVLPVEYSAEPALKEAGVAAQAGLGQDVVGDLVEPHRLILTAQPLSMPLMTHL